jgi:hypothetical protein
VVPSGSGCSSARFWGRTRSIRAAASWGDSSLAIWSPFPAGLPAPRSRRTRDGAGHGGAPRGACAWAEFDLTDACEIGRWRRNAALLGAPMVGHGAP